MPGRRLPPGPYREIESGNPGSPSPQHLPCFTPTFRAFDRPRDTAGGVERVEQPQAILGMHEKHHKAATASAGDLSGERAVGDCNVVELVDAVGGNPRSGHFLRLPGI